MTKNAFVPRIVSKGDVLNVFEGINVTNINLPAKNVDKNTTGSRDKMAESKGKAKRVLIVDDESTLREIIEQEFARRGWATAIAGGGFEAFQSLQAAPADLVVSDVRMSKGTGLQLLDSIQSSTVPKPVIVLISGYSEVDEFKAINRGAAGFFLKPFQLREFVDSVLEIFEKEHGKKVA